MLSNIAKNIIVKALRIRRERGEDPKAVIETWPRLTKEEKKEILKEVAEESKEITEQDY